MSILRILGGVLADSSSDRRNTDVAFAHLLMAYSREDELEADKLSVKYLKAAGYKPENVITTLEKMQKIHMEGPIRRYSYLKTHPYVSIRIAKAKEEIYGKIDFDSYINLPTDSGRNLP
jgi:predicted Zn-dependent protease